MSKKKIIIISTTVLLVGWLTIFLLDMYQFAEGVNEDTKNHKLYKKLNIAAYKSDANGTADIELRFLNNSFEFNMQTIPQPMTNESSSTIKSIGTWTLDKNIVRLIFTKDKPILTALFDEKYDNDAFQVINDSTVDIKTEKPEIFIWGVSCVKTNGL